MRFSDFQVGIGVSLRKKSRGALELFLSFLGWGVFRNSCCKKEQFIIPVQHFIYPWIRCLLKEQKSFPKLVFSGLYNRFLVCTLSARIISIVKLFVVDGPYMITTIIYLL